MMESKLFFRYLGFVESDPVMNNLYQKGFVEEKTSPDFSNYLKTIALRNRIFLLVGDIWTRLFCRRALLRKKLNFAVALGENSPHVFPCWEISDCVWRNRLRLGLLIALYFAALLVVFPVIFCFYLTYRIRK